MDYSTRSYVCHISKVSPKRLNVVYYFFVNNGKKDDLFVKKANQKKKQNKKKNNKARGYPCKDIHLTVLTYKQAMRLPKINIL